MPRPTPTQLQGITDLTVVAPVKRGLIDGIFDSRSYAWRLQRVLGLLDAARHASREADLVPSPLTDSVGRWRGIHFFRFAVLPPPDDRLLLNVTFDGGWEPYMRLIWGPLGSMLDLIFCHCEDYPLAAVSSYDTYIGWVRQREVPSQFFYADSGGTVADRAYLELVEARQRAQGDRPDADRRAAHLALEPARPPQPNPAAVHGALRALRALYGLTPFFGIPKDPQDGHPAVDDGSVLWRFAQDYLADLREWFARGLFDPGQPYDVLRQPFAKEREWLMSKRWSRPERRDRSAALDPRSIQGGILHSPKAREGRFARGAIVLAHVVDAEDARRWLQHSARVAPGQAAALISDGSAVDLTADRVFCTVAITYAGLIALGAHEDKLAAMPAEFAQGMEARAGILGDVRLNHPQHWPRPRAWAARAGTAAPPIDLAAVHLVIHLRTCEADGEATADRHELLPRLAQWVENQLPQSLEVLAVEPGWSRPRDANEPAARDHFGYADGISQPTLTPSADSLFWDDSVKTGELLLGWVNDRGDGPLARPGKEPLPNCPPWMDLGTFVVVRKIRQHVQRFDAVVDRAADALVHAGIVTSPGDARELVRAKLMGRGSDGSPVAPQRGAGANDFDFRHDSDGAQCPFASHIRRANPRQAGPGQPVPRLIRRGMSYGPPSRQAATSDDDRGILFLAYNASIAEQFEVIQRWLTGGNSSGVSSSHADPFVGVPQPGQGGVFRFVHIDRVVRVDLGDKAISTLQWGLYAFVPSMATLREIGTITQPDPTATVAAPARPIAAQSPTAPSMCLIKAQFEDDLARDRRWADVRKRSGVEKIGTCVMVGGHEPVLQVLRDGGNTYSAAGYGKRMDKTLGPSPFGQDDVGANGGHQKPHVAAVKVAVALAVREADACAVAAGIVAPWLARQLAGAQALGLPAANVDLVEVGRHLVAELLSQWFGVDYDDGIAQRGGLEPQDRPVRCPGHFLSVARNIFSAYPNETVKALAIGRGKPPVNGHGEALREAVAHWATHVPAAPAAPVMRAILETLDREGVTGGDERNGIVANVMLGLPATLLGSWAKVLVAWARDRRLWRLQHELLRTAGNPLDPQWADGVLRRPLVATMAMDPVADGIWRTVVQPHLFRGVEVHPDDRVWLGLGSALAEKRDDLAAAEDLLFGGHLESGTDRSTPHACPGREMAIGALLGGLAATLAAGQWAPTPSPTTLTLKPHQR